MVEELLEYPTLRQATMFKQARAANTVSLFRVRYCDVCKAEIPREFRCCSSVCFDKLPKGFVMSNLSWEINLTAILSGDVHIETKEGSMRKGQITKVNWASCAINGKKVEWPQTIELNNDASDFIEWNHILAVKKV